MEIRKQKGKQAGRLTVTEQTDQKHQEERRGLRQAAGNVGNFYHGK